jgi:hypothetical protein
MKTGRVEGGPPPRLLDQTQGEDLEPGSSTAWAIELLRSTPRYEPAPGRKQRVRLALGHGMPRRSPLLLRPVIAMGVLLGCGAIASAALGGWPRWIAQAYERVVGAEGPPSSGTSEEQRRTSRRRMTAPSSPVVDTSVPAPGVVPLSSALPAAAGDGPVAAPAARRVRRSPVAPPAEPASAVLEAMRALRVERDSPRARALLARYLEKHPNGALAEEALALTIEAAVAHGDPDAPQLGRRYLDRYPGGAFQPLARRAASRGADLK